MSEPSRSQIKTRLKSLVRILLLAAVAGAIAFFVIGYVVLHRSLPPRDGTVTVDGLGHPVKITFDAMGMPNIWAEDEFDGYFAVGYLHASDRLFQMELTRRLAQGKLSELVGDIALNHDISQRRMQHERRAEAAIHLLNEADRRRLQAYVDGINSYISTARAMPFEFYIMQIKVEPWTIRDVVALLIFQTWYADALLNRDDFFVELTRKFGRRRARTLLFDYPYWAPTTIDPIPLLGDNGSAPTTHEASILSWLPDLNPIRKIREGVDRSLFQYASGAMRLSEASNAWVLSGHKTHSGKAMLASDPHLDVSRLPQFWYCLGMHTRKDSINVFGITAPGMPMFAMGHNARAAWAFTAAGVDLTEYYEEKINPEDSTQYLAPEGWRPFETAVDTVRIAGVDTLVPVTTRFTRHGPVVIADDSLNRCYSLRWAGIDFDPAAMVAHSFALAHVHDFSAFRNIVTNLGALNANWMYADQYGTIGYQLGTPIPIRPEGAENLPQPGWVDSMEWQGYQPLNMTPNYANPGRGWLTNDNNKPERRSSYDLAGNYAADRILRATDLLKGVSEATPGDMERMQMDQTDEYLLRWKPEIAKILREIGDNKEADGIDKWDGSTSLDSRSTLIANLFLSQLTELTFGDELGEDARRVRVLWMDQYYHGDDQSWFDDTTTPDTVETRADIARKAMRRTLDIIGDDTWGDRNSITMRHPLAGIPILGKLLHLSYGPWPRSGTAGTLNASYFRETDDHHFETFVAPSWRFVIDFADIDKAAIVLPAGNSGNPASPHFADFIDLWRSGKRWTVPFSRHLIEKQAASTLILKPNDTN